MTVGVLVGLILMWALVATFVACVFWIRTVADMREALRHVMKQFLNELPPEQRARAEAIIERIEQT